MTVCETFLAAGRFHPVLREALRLREGIRSGDGAEPPPDHPVDDRARDMVEFTTYIVCKATGRG